MEVRRVVLGVGPGGKSQVLSDEPAGRRSAFESVPGFEATLLWSTSAAGAVREETGFTDPTREADFLPAEGESRLMFVTFPPDSVMTRADFDPAAFGAEFNRLLPGLADTFEPDSPGMHTTDSIDYDVVLDGEISLELDDGREVLLKKHDVAVQQGNRHAWRNKGEKPATMLFVLMGKKRAGGGRVTLEHAPADRSGPPDVVARLIDLEQQRCSALMNADIDLLRTLLHQDLVHVHAKGQVDGFESYFSTGGFNVRYQRVERSELGVRVMGNTALMTGRQLLVGIRKNGSGTVTIDSRVMQVWVKEGAQWQQLAFQTTPTEMSIS